MIVEEQEVVSPAIKIQTLLEKFTQLYDRLTVEHNLMTKRELNIIKNLEVLNETIEALNKLGPQIIKIIQETNHTAVDQVWNDLSELIGKTIDQHFGHHLSNCCRTLDKATSKITVLTEDHDQMSGHLFFAIAGGCILLGVVIGVVIRSYF